MSIVSREEALSILEPHLADIRACIIAGWAQYHAQPIADGGIASRRSRASLVHDLIVGEARARFAGQPGVRTTRERGFFALVFSERVAVRFKKLNGAMRASNIPTEQTKEFYRQHSLFGDDATNLIAGYQLDPLAVELQRVALTCPLGTGNAWFETLEEPATPSMASATPDTTAAPKTKVTAKKTALDATGS